MTNIDQERALLDRIRAGDKSACDECVRLHADGIYRLALRLMRNEAEAEDVMQDAFLSAFRAIDKFDGRSTLRTWLYRIAYNAAVMRLRKRQPAQVSLDEAGDQLNGASLPQAFFDWSSLPNRELERAEVREEMERAIGELPPRLRAVFVMRELEELSTEETAKALDVTEETVKTRLHRARLRLRERLTAYFSPGTSQGTGANP
jgi:RNA polymerase sigma-70 factor (ECF subfamily)